MNARKIGDPCSKCEAASLESSQDISTFPMVSGFPTPSAHRRRGGADSQDDRHVTPGRPHDARNRRDSGLRVMLWRRAMILHRVSVTYPRYTEGRSQNREPGERQRRFIMRYLFTRFQDDFPRGDATADGRVSETVSRVKREQRNELPAAVGERQCRSGGACQRACATGHAVHQCQWVEYTWTRLGGSRASTSRFPQLAGAAGPRMRLCESVTRT